ncbi:hypothetical protein TNCV_207541 [Trichonephila clavipes]|nr:hypothetical protein TNCV_207541 [Trichonephila clavipes]
MANRLVFMLRSEALRLDEWQQASRQGFKAWILTSRRILLLESERKSVSSYWLLESEDNGSGKMSAHVVGVSVSGVVTNVHTSISDVFFPCQFVIKNESEIFGFLRPCTARKSAGIYSGIWVRRTLNPVSGKSLFYGMADRRVFMLDSRSLLLDKRLQASRRSFEAGILTSRKVYGEESEWKSESSYWLMKSEDTARK